MDVGSVNSLNGLHDTPLPTTPDEKNIVTIKRLSYVLGFLYSVFLVTFGILIYVYSAILDHAAWGSILTLYIALSGLIILCTIIVDVKLFTGRIQKQVKILSHKEEFLELEHLRQLDASIDDENRVLQNSDENAAAIALHPPEHKLEHIDHNYCFAQGRHAGSVYLKFGATEAKSMKKIKTMKIDRKKRLKMVFALGHFVHSLLIIVVVHFSIIMHNFCINDVRYFAEVFEFIYCFVQLYFVFNYSNLIIIKYSTLARVAFLHVMAGNICLWVSSVTLETKLALDAYKMIKDKDNSTAKIDDACAPDPILSKVFDNYSAYLYPFTVEFNLLTVGIFYMIWSNIGKCRHSEEEVREFQHSLFAHTNVSGDVNSPHALDIHISCRNAMSGLFASLFVVVVLIVTIILGFVFGTMSSEHAQRIGDVISNCMYLLFHTTLLIATIVAFCKTHNLDINKHTIPWLDDVLLYVCAPAFFLETLLTAVAVVNILNVIKLLDTIIMSLQMIVQTAFIIDGLRRCSNSRKLRRTKPGRELVLFLLVTNLSMWFMYTFSYKSPESKDERYVFYGKKLWLAIGHLCMPLIMFFRFHSSVCIADIWSYAYKPGIEDH